MRYLAITILVETSLWISGFIVGESADAETVLGTLQVSETAILDTRQLASQQYRPDCWAHGAAVGAKLALIAESLNQESEPPTEQNETENVDREPAYEHSPETHHSKSTRRHVDETITPDLSEEPSVKVAREEPFKSMPKALHYVYESFPTFGEGHSIETRDHYVWPHASYGDVENNGRQADDSIQMQQYLQYFSPESLSQFTGGGGANGPEHVKQMAERMGWGQAVDMVPVAGQGWGQEGARNLVEGVLEGMKKGIRFEGFFNRNHAMTIIGADLNDLSVWVTDSNQAGSVKKLSLLGGTHIDSMLAFARKDLPEAVEWIHAAAGY